MDDKQRIQFLKDRQAAGIITDEELTELQGLEQGIMNASAALDEDLANMGVTWTETQPFKPTSTDINDQFRQTDYLKQRQEEYLRNQKAFEAEMGYPVDFDPTASTTPSQDMVTEDKDGLGFFKNLFNRDKKTKTETPTTSVTPTTPTTPTSQVDDSETMIMDTDGVMKPKWYIDQMKGIEPGSATRTGGTDPGMGNKVSEYDPNAPKWYKKQMKDDERATKSQKDLFGLDLGTLSQAAMVGNMMGTGIDLNSSLYLLGKGIGDKDAGLTIGAAGKSILGGGRSFLSGLSTSKRNQYTEDYMKDMFRKGMLGRSTEATKFGQDVGGALFGDGGTKNKWQNGGTEPDSLQVKKSLENQVPTFKIDLTEDINYVVPPVEVKTFDRQIQELEVPSINTTPDDFDFSNLFKYGGMTSKEKKFIDDISAYMNGGKHKKYQNGGEDDNKDTDPDEYSVGKFSATDSDYTSGTWKTVNEMKQGTPYSDNYYKEVIGGYGEPNEIGYYDMPPDIMSAAIQSGKLYKDTPKTEEEAVKVLIDRRFAKPTEFGDGFDELYYDVGLDRDAAMEGAKYKFGKYGRAKKWTEKYQDGGTSEGSYKAGDVITFKDEKGKVVSGIIKEVKDGEIILED